MTREEFNTAIAKAYEQARRYGDDSAGIAITRAFERGAGYFNDEIKLTRYVIRTAKYARGKEHLSEQRQRRREQEYIYGEGIPDDYTVALDMQTVTQGLDVDMRDAIAAYIDGETLSSASQLIRADVSTATKYFWLKTVIEGMEEKLRDYKR
jgi:hypothetical protein